MPCFSTLTIIALILAATAPVAAQLGLTFPPDLSPDIEALPRLTGQDEAALRINQQMEALDKKLQDKALGCKALPKSWWERHVEVTFIGPGYLSITTVDDFYCDGAVHPNSFLQAITFDLATGQELDWRLVLPSDLAANEPNKFSLSDLLITPALVELYLKANPIYPAECRFEISPGPSYFKFWLSAQDQAVILMPSSLSHAMQACADTVALPVAALREMGVDGGIVAALLAAGK